MTKAVAAETRSARATSGRRTSLRRWVAVLFIAAAILVLGAAPSSAGHWPSSIGPFTTAPTEAYTAGSAQEISFASDTLDGDVWAHACMGTPPTTPLDAEALVGQPDLCQLGGGTAFANSGGGVTPSSGNYSWSSPGGFSQYTVTWGGFVLHPGSQTDHTPLVMLWGAPGAEPEPPSVCTLQDLSGCTTWNNGTVSEIGPDSGEAGWWNCKLETHCIVWTKDRPQVPPADPMDSREWTFGVGDIGSGLPPIWTKTYVVGWTCADQGPIFPNQPRTPVEGYADFHWNVKREFFVACPVGQYIWNFYVLDMVSEGGTNYSAETLLFWGYGPPGSATPTDQAPTAPETPTECGEDCTATPPSAPPAPTYQAPPAPSAPATDPPPPAGDCDFGITDPSSWLCSLGGVFGQVLDAIKRIGSWLAAFPSMLMDLLVPDAATLQASFDDVDVAWDASGPGQLTGGLTDISAPLLNLQDSAPTTCSGPLLTFPIPGDRSFAMHPLSTCSELSQWILSILLPLEAALVYIGGFFLALRIVTRPFGMDTPGGTQAAI